MTRLNFKWRNVAMIIACLAATMGFASCEPEEDNTIDPDAPAITEFSFFGQRGVAVIDPAKRTVKATAECGVNIASLTPEFTLSPEGATAKVDGKLQTSGTTAVNFSEPVKYILATADGETTVEWTVTINLPDDCPTVKKYITYNQPVKAYLIEYNGGAIAANQSNRAGKYGTVLEAYENKKYTYVEWGGEGWFCDVLSNTAKGYFSWYSWNSNGTNVWMEHDDQAGTDGWNDGGWEHSEYPLDKFAFLVSKWKVSNDFIWRGGRGGLNDLCDVARNPDYYEMPNNTEVTQYYLRSEKICNIMCDVYKIMTVTFWVDPDTGFTLKVDSRDDKGNIDEADSYEVTRLIVGTPDWNGEHLRYNAAGGDTYRTP